MEAIVLAGGLGTRLQSVVSDVPKPMAPIGEKPFLEYIFRYLKKNNITRIILSVGYKWETIKEYFGDSYDDMELVYSVENEPLGTGGAIKKAISYVNEDEVYIINGDTFFDVDLSHLKLVDSSKIKLSLKKMYDFDRYGCVESDKYGFVTNFSEKSHRPEGNINGGIYLAKTDVFDAFDLKEKFSFEVFMEENFKQLHISTEVFNGYFIDIGIPADYARAQAELKKFL